MIIISLHSNNDLSLFLASPKPYLDFGIDPSCITAEQHYITYSHTEQNTSEGHYEISPKDVSFVRNQGCLDVSGQNDSFPIDRSPRCSWRRNRWRSCSPGKRPAREGKQIQNTKKKLKKIQNAKYKIHSCSPADRRLGKRPASKGGETTERLSASEH